MRKRSVLRGVAGMALVAAALGQLGCSAQRTAQITPTALPALAEDVTRSPAGRHATIGRDGQPLTLRGHVSAIRVVREGPDGYQERRFEAPVSAYFGDPEGYGLVQLVVVDEEQMEAFAPAADTRTRVFVEYEDESVARTQRGSWYLVGGAIALGVSAFNLSYVADGPDEGAGGGYMLVAGMGILSGVTGLGLSGVGLHLLSTDPPEREADQGSLSVQLGPTGGLVRGTF
jgi:hypothetical protein